MADQNDSLPQDEVPVVFWTTTAHRWADGSDDLALPIPIHIEQALGLTDNSVLNAAFVDGRLVISKILKKSAPDHNDA